MRERRGAYRGAGLAIQMTGRDGAHIVKWWDKDQRPNLTRFDTKEEADRFAREVRLGAKG
jgi:hypothetical protein